MSRNKKLAFFVGLVGAVFLVYANVYDMGFLYDDEFFIVRNKFITSFDYFFDIFQNSANAGAGFKDSFFRPLQFVLYLFTYQIVGGLDPVGFHFLNVLLHALNTYLVFRLAQTLRLKPGVAAAAALGWGFHPVHVECIAYMSGTADSLHAFFLLLGLNVMAPTFSWRSLALGGVCFIAAMFSKEPGVIGPGLLVSVIFLLSPRRWNWRSYIKTLPFWILSLSYVILRQTLWKFGGDFYEQPNLYTENSDYRFYTFLATLPNYFGLLLWPQKLHIDRAFPVYTSLSDPYVLTGLTMLIGSLAFLATAFVTRKPALVWPSWAILWFAAAQTPHAGVFIPVNSFFLEHWMYTPSIALIFLSAAGVQALGERPRFRQSRMLMAGIAGLVIVALGQKTFRQNRVWESPVSLFKHIVELNPQVARVHHDLAMAYSDQGENQKALEHYKKALEIQEYPQTYHNLAILFLKQDKKEQAEEYLLRAISLDPAFFPSYTYLVNLYEALGKKDKADEYRKKFEQVAPK